PRTRDFFIAVVFITIAGREAVQSRCLRDGDAAGGPGAPRSATIGIPRLSASLVSIGWPRRAGAHQPPGNGECDRDVQERRSGRHSDPRTAEVASGRARGRYGSTCVYRAASLAKIGAKYALRPLIPRDRSGTMTVHASDGPRLGRRVDRQRLDRVAVPR